MRTVEQTGTFRLWLARLRDDNARGVVVGRIHRLAHGLPGDVQPVGHGISELRIHVGPGYRVYFVQRGQTLILLLCGGDKSSQRRDIERARQLAENRSHLR
ncbi:type II toxin-antitoxin system RelE/ParE family toxin [Leptothrix sp. BB-4]